VCDFIAPDQEEAIISLVRELIGLGQADSFHVKRAWYGADPRYGRRVSADSRDEAPRGWGRSVPLLVWTQCVPDALVVLADMVRRSLGVSDVFDSFAVNEYAPGGGIHPHIDSSRFAELIVIVSVGEACAYTFALDPWSHTLIVPRRSLLVMRAEARYACTHAVEVDPAMEKTRYSVILRTRA
jgi:alkylated DNA repair dioxygenase AlkB